MIFDIWNHLANALIMWKIFFEKHIWWFPLIKGRYFYIQGFDSLTYLNPYKNEVCFNILSIWTSHGFPPSCKKITNKKEEAIKAISMSCFPRDVCIIGILSLTVGKWHKLTYGIALIFKICLYHSPCCWWQRGRNI